MEDLRFIMQYIKRHKWHYAAGIVTLFVVDFANLYIPRITGAVTDGLSDHTMDWSGVKNCLLGLLLLGLTLAVGRFLWRYFLFGSARKIEKELRNDMFAHLEKMSVDYFNENKTGDLMTRFTSDLNAIRMAIGMAVISAFDATVMTVMVIGQMMVYVNVKLTLLALIPMVVICVGTVYYGKVIHARYMERQEAVSDLTDYVQESFSGIRVIKAFVREQAQLKAFTKANEKTREKNLSLVRLQAGHAPFGSVYRHQQSGDSDLWRLSGHCGGDYPGALCGFPSVCEYAGMAHAGLRGSNYHVFPGAGFHQADSGSV